LPELVAGLVGVLPSAAESFEILLVVDGGPPDTWEVARGLAGEFGEVRALRLARNYGQHNALIAGVRSARYEVVVTMDDDLQHPPSQVPVLLAALTDELDLVYGVPVEEEHGVARSFLSRSVKRGLASAVPDARSISALRVFRTFLRDAFERLEGPEVSLDVGLSWATTRIGQTTVRMENRTIGQSNYTLGLLIRHALTLITGYSVAPLRVAGYLGVVSVLVGLGLFVVAAFQGFGGVTTIAAVVVVFSGTQLVALGVLGEYVGRLHTGSSGRPTYVIREREGD
jgi:undecaprenyl-phosphate 4-deoxy-4-formamido-L-arabinose transferase